MFDGGIFLGRNPSTGVALEEADFIHKLDQLEISRTIVASYKSIFYDSLEGNEDVLNFASKNPHRIIPSIAIQSLGHDCTYPTNPIKHLKRMGAQVLGLYKRPSYYSLDFKSPVNQYLVRLAATERMTIQFGVESLNDLTDIYECYRSLKTPVLVRWMAGQGYQALSTILYFSKILPNFYFDVGSLTSIGATAHLVSKVGAKRLFYSSNLPEGFAYPSQFLIRSAGLSQKNLDQILQGTLAQLFSSTKKVVAMPNQEVSQTNKLFKQYRAIPKIDTHWHAEGWNLIEPKKDLAFFAHSKHFYNIQKAIFSSIKALNGFMEEGNSSLFKWVEKTPNVYALIVVDPTRPAESIQQIKKYANHPRCVGIKTIQDLYKMSLDSKEYAPLLAAARQKQLTVMAHISGMALVAKKFPGVRFVCAHATWERVKNFIHQKNIYFDLATSHQCDAETRLPEMIRAAKDRLLFASDASLMDPAWTLGKIASVKVSKDILKQIFYTNALNAFPRLATAPKT